MNAVALHLCYGYLRRPVHFPNTLDSPSVHALSERQKIKFNTYLLLIFLFSVSVTQNESQEKIEENVISLLRKAWTHNHSTVIHTIYTLRITHTPIYCSSTLSVCKFEPYAANQISEASPLSHLYGVGAAQNLSQESEYYLLFKKL